MPWPEPLKKQASRSKAARFAASCDAKGCAGATRTVGARLAIKTLSAIRTAVVTHYSEAPAGSTTVATSELGAVIPRTFDPAPGWSPNGHRIKAPLDYEGDPEKTWVYGALRVRDGKELTHCAASRNSKNSIELLKDIEADNPTGDMFIITDNLSSHYSLETRTWLADHPRIQHVFIPTGARLRSICKKAGGGSSAVTRWLAKALPIPRKSSRPPAWPQPNSTGEPSPGSGDGLPRPDVAIGASFLIAFKELSTSTTVTVMGSSRRGKGAFLLLEHLQDAIPSPLFAPAIKALSYG
jgi:hypothetical protein